MWDAYTQGVLKGSKCSQVLHYKQKHPKEGPAGPQLLGKLAWYSWNDDATLFLGSRVRFPVGIRFPCDFRSILEQLKIK